MNRKLFAVILLFGCVLSAIPSQVYFHSVTDAVDFALQNSKTHAYQKLSGLGNMERAKYAFRDFFPTVNVSFSEADSVSFQSADSRSKNFQISLSQLIFDGGKRRFAYDEGKLSSLYTYREFEQTLRAFCSDIMNQYYTVLKQKELVSIKTELVEAAVAQLQILKKESELGLALETDYLEYMISYLKIENEKRQAVRELEKRERSFKQSLGLDNTVNLIINDEWGNFEDAFLLEDFLDTLFPLVKANSLELKKQELSAVAAQKQAEFSKRWYLPTISIEGGISFSGTNYPLTEPDYSVKISIGFENNPLFPFRISNGYGFRKDSLYSVNNSVSTSILPDSTYFVQRNLTDISLLQNQLQHANTVTALYESLYETIVSHDDTVQDIRFTIETIRLQEKRLEFSKLQLEKGEKKHIDFLKELIDLSSQRIILLEKKTSAAALERSIEISTQIPFGELKYVCQN